ncbi:MAG: DNA-protecting protein DprA [bacterium]|nr:DNA-protecting protein DprA [bacterium]
MYPCADLIEISHRLLYRVDLSGMGQAAEAGLVSWRDFLREREGPNEGLPDRGQIERLAESCKRDDIRATWLCDPAYPTALLDLKTPPPVLFYQGALPPPQASLVSIVGSRRASRGGLDFARRLGGQVAATGLSVVSGMARGIDQAAHRGCLEMGETWAVLGCGLDTVYPPEARKLAQKISSNGGLLSEFPPAVPPLPYHFPRRNRLIASLSRALIVVEAGVKSGALSTAREALHLGRPLGVVPANPLNPSAAGSNRLLNEGAILILGPEDLPNLLEDIRLFADGDEPWDSARCLEEGVDDVETLAARTGWLLTETLARVAQWEREGLLICLSGGRFRIEQVSH